jgi:hypothetical protein
MRDDFNKPVKEQLAKRVGFKCSNPECQRATCGPQKFSEGTVNLGVAAHISAASDGGPRYDTTISADQRRSYENGIWLCQNCAKLIDSDEGNFTIDYLLSWKQTSESLASNELNSQGTYNSTNNQIFSKIENLMPELLAEMSSDIKQHPLRRELVLLKKKWLFNSKEDLFVYFYEEHSDLKSTMRILENHGLVSEITFNDVTRYLFEENFVDYLTSKSE